MSDNASNIHEFTVSELAQSIKRTVEETYGHVRVRGELGRVTIAKSGHCYLDIKDERAVINSIIWKGALSRLSMRPEEGLEVIVEGRLSTYPGRSNYQLIIEKMDLAGEGALMALFERRKKAFLAEGLFDESRKVPLPFLPKKIGVITSPSGAVIRDILHRIQDRFPTHILVWPVLVQGDKAAEQIAGAITGFNHINEDLRPDLLIVARGGGSLEDLWCFNEENVVRAASQSTIPLISAVGHETDWTLIDYVADYRAPTPTGAAEVAVPVREDYEDTISDYALRLSRAQKRYIREHSQRLKAARLPKTSTLLSAVQQRLDLALARLPTPQHLYDKKLQTLAIIKARFPAMSRLITPYTNSLGLIAQRLRPDRLRKTIDPSQNELGRLSIALTKATHHNIHTLQTRLSHMGGLLEAYSYQDVLRRGYVLVSREGGQIVRSYKDLSSGESVNLKFVDGDRQAIIDADISVSSKASTGGASISGSSIDDDTTKHKARKSKQQNRTPKTSDEPQGRLFE